MPTLQSQSALIASVMTGATSWTDHSPWTATAFWLCALLHSLFAIVVASQQSVALTRASCAPDGLTKIRILIGAIADSPSLAPQNVQSSSAPTVQIPSVPLFVWQVPTMMLGTSVMPLLFGLMVHVYSSAHEAERCGREVKIAVRFSFSCAFGLSQFISWDSRVKVARALR